MTVTVLTGRALNNQPFLVSAGVAGVAPGSFSINSPVMASTSAALTWNKPATGTAPFDYQVKYKLHSDSSYTNGPTVTNNSNSSAGATVTGLSSSTVYDFEVVVSNGYGSPLTSAAVPGTTNAPVGSAPGPLTDFTFTQPHALHPATTGDTGGGWVGWFDPVGGIGPYSFYILQSGSPTKLAFNYLITNPTGADKREALVVYYDPVGSATDTFTVRCVDGRGAVVNKSISITKTDGTATVFWQGLRNPTTSIASEGFYNGPHFKPQAVGGTWDRTTYPTTVLNTTNNTASTMWITAGNDSVYPASPPAASNSYPVRVGLTDGNNDTSTYDFTIVIQDPTPISYIEFTQNVLSTSAPVNTVLGTAAATTPWNNPVWSLNDPSNTFLINPLTGRIVLAQAPTSTDSIPISITVSDNNAQPFTQSFTIVVTAGSVVAPTNMTMAMPTTFTNITDSGTVGTPTVTGISGTKRWSLKQSHTNADAQSALPRFSIDSSTGTVTLNGLLAAHTFDLTLICTNGVDYCIQTFHLIVSEAPTTEWYYVGRGFSTTLPAGAHAGAVGYETMGALRGDRLTDNVRAISGRTGTAHVYVYADADDDYYAEDNGANVGNYAARYAWGGPIIIEGVAANGKAQPRVGGFMTKWHDTGFDMRGKGFMVFGTGDAVVKNMHFSHCLGNTAQDYACEAIRKDGDTYGNFTVLNCRIEQCDQGITGGLIGSDEMVIDACEVVGCGTSHLGRGAQHNFYIDDLWKCTVTNTISIMSVTGHNMKMRAQRSLLQNCRFYDLERGSASNQINYPQGGDHVVDNCVLHKGPHQQNPYMIQFNDEPGELLVNTNNPRNNLLVQNSTFISTGLPGNHTGDPCAIQHWASFNPIGIPSAVQSVSNSFFMAHPYDPNNLNLFSNSPMTVAGVTNTGTITASGTTILTSMPVLDLSRPYLSGGQVEFIDWYRLLNQYGQDDYADWDGRQIQIGSEHLILSHTTSSGTTIGTCRANTEVGYQDVGNDRYAGPNPFTTGSTWALVNDDVYYAYNAPNPWSNSKYSITTNSDGTATLKTAATLTAGIDFIQIRVTSPDASKTGKKRFYVVVT